MPFKFLPAADDWEKALGAVKVKPDSALSKALAESFKVDSDQPEKRYAMLPKIQKLATDFKKSKDVVAAGPKAAQVVQDLIDVIPSVRRTLEQTIKDLKSNAACEIDVQFMVHDWNKKSFQYGECFAEFESPGMPTIRRNGKLSASGMSINDIKLRSLGTVSLMVVPGGSMPRIEGTSKYEFKPGQKLMQFKGVQMVKKQKVRAKSGYEAIKKFGLKGSVGLDFKVVSGGAELTEDSEYKHAYEDEIEFEIEAGLPTFESFEQTR